VRGRHDRRTGDTFLTVDRLVDGAWLVVAVDSSFDTLLRFERVGGVIYAQVEWTVPNATGTYRITHRASALHAGDRLEEFVGVSRDFSVGEAASQQAAPVWLQAGWDALRRWWRSAF